MLRGDTKTFEAQDHCEVSHEAELSACDYENQGERDWLEKVLVFTAL